MGIKKSMYLTSFSSSKAVKTLTKTRYLDALLLLVGLEKPMLALCIFLSLGLKLLLFSYLLTGSSFSAVPAKW